MYLLSSLSLENSSSWNIGPLCSLRFLLRQVEGRVESLSKRAQSIPTLLGAGK